MIARRTASSAARTGPRDKPWTANYRGLGLADMARAIADSRPHRANGEVGLHVLAVMDGILEAATEGQAQSRSSSNAQRPPMLDEAEAASLLA